MNKTMKKALAVLLALSMMFSLAVTAYAAKEEQNITLAMEVQLSSDKKSADVNLYTTTALSVNSLQFEFVLSKAATDAGIAATGTVGYPSGLNPMVEEATGFSGTKMNGDAALSATDGKYILGTLHVTIPGNIEYGEYAVSAGNLIIENTTTKYTPNAPTTNIVIEAPDRAINIDTVTGGSVTAEVDNKTVTTAKSEDTVTLVPVAEEGYEFVSLAVKDADGSDVDVDGNNTFTMPDKDVTVTAEFKKLAYAVKFEKPENAQSIAVTVGGKPIDTGDTVEWGKTVSVTVTPKAPVENQETGKTTRYKLTELKANDEVLTISNNSGSFTMPKEAVTITGTIADTKGNTVTVELTPSVGSIGILDTKNSTDSENKFVSELTVEEEATDRTVTIYVTNLDLTRYKIESVEVAGTATGSTTKLSLGKGVTQAEVLKKGGVYTFKMPAEDVKATVTVAEIQEVKSYALKFSDATVTVGGESVKTGGAVKTGATVTVTPTAAGTGEQISSVEYTYVNDSNVSITNVIELNSKGVGTFEMPAANTTITVNYETKTYTAKFYENEKTKAAEYEDLAITFKHSDKTITLPAAPTTDNEAIFKGWVNKADADKKTLAAGDKFAVDSADVSFYAYWQPADDIAGTVNDIIDGLGNSNVDVSADAVQGEPDVNVSQSIAKDDVKKAEDSAKSLSFDNNDVNNFNTPTVKKDAAVEALVKAGVITYDTENKTTKAGDTEITSIEVQTEVYLDVEVNGYTTEEDGSRSLEADITAMAKTTVIAKDDDDKKQGEVTISDKETKLNKKTQLSMELPENFFATGGDLANLTITHNPDSDDAEKIAVDKITYKANKDATEVTVNVKTDEYKAGIYTVYFTVDSLSPFLFTTTVGAKIGDEVYATAQAAINAAENGDKVEVVIAPQDGKLYIPTGLVVRIANKTNEDIKLAPKSDRASVYPTLVQAGETEDVRATANYGFDFADWFLIGRGGTGKGLITVYVNEKDGAVVTVGTNSVTIVPNTGYKISKITVNGGEVAIPANGVLGGLNAFDVVAITLVKTGASTGFVDVPAGMWYEGAVAWAVSKGITTGKGSVTTFAPMDTCTRAEAVTFLYRAAGSPAVATTAQFKDVAADAWYAKAVAWAVANGITKGTGDGTTFSPDETCSRAEIVTFLARLAGDNTTTAPTQFKDVAATDWFAGSVAWAVNNGVTTGTGDGTTFSPNTTCTRAEIVTFLYRDFVKVA